jgi:hypothetical protein
LGVRLSLLIFLNFSAAQEYYLPYDTYRRSFQEQPHKKEYWQNELQSLGIEPKRQNELNDKAELEALAESIKLVYFQDYKTAYGSNKYS